MTHAQVLSSPPSRSGSLAACIDDGTWSTSCLNQPPCLSPRWTPIDFHASWTLRDLVNGRNTVARPSSDRVERGRQR